MYVAFYEKSSIVCDVPTIDISCDSEIAAIIENE